MEGKKRPTVHELEDIMEKAAGKAVTLNPDGSISIKQEPEGDCEQESDVLTDLRREVARLREALRIKMIRAIDWQSKPTGIRVNRECGLCLHRWHYQSPEDHAPNCEVALAQPEPDEPESDFDESSDAVTGCGDK